MNGDNAARAGLGGLATAAGMLGLGILVPGLKDVLIAFLDQTLHTKLYNASPAVGWLLLLLAVVLYAPVFLGPARCWELVQHGLGTFGTTKGRLVALKQTGFDPNLPDLRREELPDDLARRDIQHIDVDLSGNLRRSPPELDRASEAQLQVPLRLQAASGDSAATQLAYCGIVQAPFQLLAGHQLANWAHVLPFEWDRARRRWWSLAPGQGTPLGLAVQTEPVAAGTELAVAVEISSAIDARDILGSVPAVAEIVRIGAPAPALDLLTHQDQALAIAAAFRAALDQARARHGAGHRIHVFCAAPMSVGFAIGRQISPTIDGPVTAYAFDAQSAPRYPWGITVNARPHGPQAVRT